MFTLTIKELAARKLRLLTTAFAVLLGVAFMAGTLVFTDTVGATFDSALAEANDGVDAYVRTPSEIDLGYGEPGPRLDASLADTVASVDGVDQVALRINGYAQLVGRRRQPGRRHRQEPGVRHQLGDRRRPQPVQAGQRSRPDADDEIVIDKASADKAGYQPGDVATVLTKQRAAAVHDRRHRHVRRRRLPGRGDGGAVHRRAPPQSCWRRPARPTPSPSLPTPVCRRPTSPRPSQAAVGDDVEVITGAALIAENQAALGADFAEFETFMLVFAIVAVFVGAFIINNTFSITVAQRTREMAMLRAIGASGRQVKRSVLLEAVVDRRARLRRSASSPASAWPPGCGS